MCEHSQRKGYDLWTRFMIQVGTLKLLWIGDCKTVLQEVMIFLKDCTMLRLSVQAFCLLFEFAVFICLSVSSYVVLRWFQSVVPLLVSWHLVLIYSVGSQFVFAGEMNCVTWYKPSVCNAETLSLGCEFIFSPCLKPGCELFF